MRWDKMRDALEDLERRMAAASAALNFEEARRLRDVIALVRSGATLADAEAAGGTGLTRQRPGAMGLGTSQQKTEPPPGWKQPPPPDLMTTGRSRRKRKP
jgi:hypothetical protein